MSIHTTQKKHIVILIVSMVVTVTLALFLNVLYEFNNSYTHLFYIPIVMTSVWFRKKALHIAAFLGILHISLEFYINGIITINSIFTAAMFFIAALVILILNQPKKESIPKNPLIHTHSYEEEELILRFELFFSSSPIPTWISRLKDGMYEAVNPAFTKLMGHTQEELIGKCSNELKHFLNAEDRLVISRQIHDKGFIENVEVTIQNKEAKQFVILASAKCFQYKNDTYIVGTLFDITERKQIEEQLTHTQTLLSQMQKLAHTGLWELDLKTEEIWASENTYVLYGLSTDRQYNWYEANEGVPAEDKELHYLKLKALLEHNEPYDIDFRLYRKSDGQLRYIHAVATVLRDKDGQPYKLLGEIQDITERKILEEEYTQIIQTTMVGFWLCDLKGQIIKVNDAFCDMLGYSYSELINGSISKVLYHRVQENIDKRFSKIKEDGSLRYQTRHKHKDGTIIDIETIATYMPSSGLICAFARDVTEKNKAEKALKTSEEQFRLLVSQMQLGLAVHEIVCNDDGIPIDYRFISVNKSYEELTGLKEEELVGKTILEVFPNTERYWIELYGSVALTGEPQQYENYSSSLGKYFSVSAYSPRINQFALILNDISEKRKAEEQILSLSYHDQLTNLYNRRYYEEIIDQLNQDKDCLPLSIIMADVNGLKLTNDVFGHEAGDILLTTVANILKRECNEKDIIARIGGDEFVILLPNSNSRDTKMVVERIEASVSSEITKNVVLSISMGHATKYNSFSSINEIFKDAEDNMYRNKLIESAQMKRSTIQYIMNTLYRKNVREMHHFQAVSNICGIFAKVLNLDTERTKKLKTAGLMHDIGKIALNLDILDKPTNLDFQEWVEVKRHCETGYRILSSNDEYSDIARYVLEHHERWDGEGYPKGLKGEEITLQARIITLSDAFDAMTSPRAYNRTFTIEEAVKEIRDNAGTQFDPKLSDVFIEQVLPLINANPNK